MSICSKCKHNSVFHSKGGGRGGCVRCACPKFELPTGETKTIQDRITDLAKNNPGAAMALIGLVRVSSQDEFETILEILERRKIEGMDIYIAHKHYCGKSDEMFKGVLLQEGMPGFVRMLKEVERVKKESGE